MRSSTENLVKAIAEMVIDELESIRSKAPDKEEIEKIQASLLPCPHCGSLAVNTNDKKAAVFFDGRARTPKYYKVECYRCNAYVEQSSVEAAIRIWNSRA